MLVKLGLAEGSLIKGMDIEFIDQIDERKKWCQLKSGPNTINSGDVKPLVEKFTKTINLARTNSAFKNIRNTDFIVGVLYGSTDDLSMHYREINNKHPVLIGEDFWHRVTGFPGFYENLIENLETMIDRIDTGNFVEQGIKKLTEEIDGSGLFDFN